MRNRYYRIGHSLITERIHMKSRHTRFTKWRICDITVTCGCQSRILLFVQDADQDADQDA